MRGALTGDGGRDAGNPQGRRCLPAAGSELSAAAAAIHGEGCGRHAGARAGGAEAGDRRRARAGPGPRAPRGVGIERIGPAGVERRSGERAAASGVRDVHLWVDGRAEGCGGDPPQHRAPGEGGRVLRAGSAGGAVAGGAAVLRCGDVRDLGCAAQWSAVRAGRDGRDGPAAIGSTAAGAPGEHVVADGGTVPQDGGRGAVAVVAGAAAAGRWGCALGASRSAGVGGIAAVSADQWIWTDGVHDVQCLPHVRGVERVRADGTDRTGDWEHTHVRVG